MTKRLIALASADWHIHKWKNFDVDNSRLGICIGCADMLLTIANMHKVPLLFSGDLLHSPKDVENETNAKIQKVFREAKGIMIGIPGNHDQCQKNSLVHRSPNHLDAIPEIVQLGIDKEKVDSVVDKNMIVQGVPYMNNDHDTKRAIIRLRKRLLKVNTNGLTKILLLHSDLPGAKTPEGYVVGESDAIPNKMDKFFNAWDLVLCGHIHLPQRLSKKCFMLGPPLHQTIGDEGHDFGYWEVYSDKTLKFKKLNYPKFITLKKGDTVPINDPINYYVPYDEVLVDEEVQMGEFNLTKSKAKLAASYLALKNIKSKPKKRALIKILNTTE